MALNIENEGVNILNSSSTVWDSVVSCFQCNNPQHPNLTPGKDNYENVWPVLKQVINKQLSWSVDVSYRACDFGCGVGNFAEQLSQMNFHTFACDISKEMIARACELTQGNVIYEVGNSSFVRKHSPFQLIISVMVFQFVTDLKSVINTFADCLDDEGILFFAIHHSEYVQECVKWGQKFRELENKEFPTTGKILIGDKWIKTYIRSPEWYDELLSAKGFVRIGYTLNEKSPLSGLSEDECNKWSSSKYYMAWYKKNI